eukprot:646674-Pelagomonas_calceolata.AAC.2
MDCWRASFKWPFWLHAVTAIALQLKHLEMHFVQGREQEKETLGVQEHGQQHSRSPFALFLACPQASCV